MYCKRVRIGDQFWHSVSEHSLRERQLSHGLCPECFRETVAQLQSYQPNISGVRMMAV